MGPKEPVCPNCKQGLWLNNSISLSAEEAADLDVPLVDGKSPIFCRTCNAEVSRVIYDLIQRLLEQGDRIYDWVTKERSSHRTNPDWMDIICR
jgi:hypothetical protein